MKALKAKFAQSQSGNDSVKVILRLRPFNKLEKRVGETKKWKYVSENDNIILAPPKKPHKKQIRIRKIKEEKGEILFERGIKEYSYDRVLGRNTTQSQMFDISAKNVCDDLLAGYNGTIFAYGHAGTGKTYTMYGPENSSSIINENEIKEESSITQHLGIIPRSIAHLFASLNNKETIELQGMHEYTFETMFLEIYCEQLRNLLKLTDEPRIRERKIPGTKDEWESYIDGSQWTIVKSHTDTMLLKDKAIKNRTVASTGLNESSSRSHMVMLVRITMIFGNAKRVGLGSFVDLAGSENVAKSNASGQVLNEAKKINQSLTTLSMVIEKLSTGGLPPYKDSQLTRLLSNSLGGNCRTTLLLAASPHVYNRNETIRSLNFGKSCRNIKNKAKQNEEMTKSQLLKEVERLTAVNKTLEAKLSKQLKKKKGLFNKNSSNTDEKSDIDKIEDSTNILFEDLQKQKTENTKLLKKISELRQTIEQLMTQQQQLEFDSQQIDKSKNEIEEKYNKLITENESNISGLEEKNKVIEELNDKVGKMMDENKRVNVMSVENERLKNERVEYEGQIKKLKDDIKEMNEIKKQAEQKLMKSLNEHGSKNEELNILVTQLKNDIENTNNENNKLTKMLEDNKLLINQIKNDKNKIEDEIGSLKDEINEKNKLNNELSKLNNVNTKNINELNDKINELNNEISENKKENDSLLNEMKQKLENMAVNNETLSNENTTLKEENRLLKERLRSELASIASEKDKLQELESINAKLKEDHSTKLEALKKEKERKKENEAQIALLKLQANEMAKMYKQKVSQQINQDEMFARQVYEREKRKKKKIDSIYRTPGGPDDEKSNNNQSGLNFGEYDDDEDDISDNDYELFENDKEFEQEISYARTLAYIQKFKEEEKKREQELLAKKRLDELRNMEFIDKLKKGQHKGGAHLYFQQKNKNKTHTKQHEYNDMDNIVVEDSK